MTLLPACKRPGHNRTAAVTAAVLRLKGSDKLREHAHLADR
jgi:hypothetical protein